jgi:type II secretory ATPase GspE/PulE/Tfp pilus assembly ATPase PilB-like protein
MNDSQALPKFPRLAAAFASHPERFPDELAARYERLACKIEALWGTPEAVRYLDSLMLSDRSNRHGFSEKVLMELANVKDAHDADFPGLGDNPHDPFAAAAAVVARASQESPQPEAPAPRAVDAADLPPPVDRRALAALASALQLRDNPWPEVRSIDEFRIVLETRRAGGTCPGKDARRLGEILQGHGLVSADTIEAAIHVQRGQAVGHEPIGHILRKMGVVGDDEVTRALCQQSGILMVDLHELSIESATMKRVPIDVARGYRAIPAAIIDGHLFLAVENPLAFAGREYFSFLTNLIVEPVFAAANRITQRLAEYGQAHSAADADREFRNLAQKAFVQLPANGESNEHQVISEEDATVVGLVNKMINDAAASDSSDIHLEAFPGGGRTRIRFRRDGRLEDYSEFSSAYHEAVISRIKIMADLDISERRRPQDGKICFLRPGKPQLDLRVATIPTIRGIEDVTIRLLPAGEPMAIDAIGMSERDLAVFRRLIGHPYGLILVCGPTGSGKTTTLHSALRELNTAERKIWTAEDPVEIVQKNICQVQVNARIGWTFANALRAFLRADPDVIMIGEMRDQETARIALEASMTGHLVLSTLHTNSASETATRLMDLGADPFNLADALLGILAQRLARRICPDCAERVPLIGADLDDLASEYCYAALLRQPSYSERDTIISEWRHRFGRDGELALMRPKGCERCQGAGYRGRLGLYEVLQATPAIRRLVRSQAAAADFQQTAIGEGMTTLKQDGIHKALRGLTDMQQVRSACI